MAILVMRDVHCTVQVLKFMFNLLTQTNIYFKFIIFILKISLTELTFKLSTN